MSTTIDLEARLRTLSVTTGGSLRTAAFACSDAIPSPATCASNSRRRLARPRAPADEYRGLSGSALEPHRNRAAACIRPGRKTLLQAGDAPAVETPRRYACYRARPDARTEAHSMRACGDSAMRTAVPATAASVASSPALRPGVAAVPRRENANPIPRAPTAAASGHHDVA